jgi:hypothetical protein
MHSVDRHDKRKDDKDTTIVPGEGIHVDAAQLRGFLVNMARDVDGLRSVARRCAESGDELPATLNALLERLEQDIELMGLNTIDPTGQRYDTGMRYEIAQLEPGGEGDLFVQRTVAPGVTLGGAVLVPPTVVLARRIDK